MPTANFVGDDWERYMAQQEGAGADPFGNPQQPGYQSPQDSTPWGVANDLTGGDLNNNLGGATDWAQMIFDPHSSPLGGITDTVFAPGNKYLEAGSETAASAIGPANQAMGMYGNLYNQAGNVAEAMRIDPRADLTQYQMGSPLDAGPDLQLQGTAVAPLEASQFQNLQVDPTGRDAQLAALDYFTNLSTGGPDAVADAEYQRRRGQAEQLRRSQDEATMAQMQARGMGGSGQELLGSLMANQGAASDAHQAGLDAAAQMQQRRDNAAMQGAGVGYGLAGQDFGQAATRAGALDDHARAAWDRWYGQALNNATIQNAASQANWANQQDVNRQNWGRRNFAGDQNVGVQNQAAYWNAGLPQTGFNNAMAAAGGYTGAVGQHTSAVQGAANAQQNQGQSSTNPIEGFGKFALGLLG